MRERLARFTVEIWPRRPRPMTLERHTDREFEAEFGRVRDNLLRMTGRVEQMTAESVRAILDGDALLARRTIEADHRVNRLEVDTDDLCPQPAPV